MKNMKAEFEQWYKNTYILFGQSNFLLNANNEYFDVIIEASWKAWQAALSAVPAQNVGASLFLLKSDCLAQIEQFKYGHDAAKAVEQIDLRKYLELAKVPANHIGDADKMVQSEHNPCITCNGLGVVSTYGNPTTCGDCLGSKLEPTQQPAQKPQQSAFITGLEALLTLRPNQEQVFTYIDAFKPAQDALQKQLDEMTRRHDQQVRTNKRLIKAWKEAQQSAQEPVSENLKNAVATVLEGWTLPDGVRKILETAYFQQPVKQENNSEHVCNYSPSILDGGGTMVCSCGNWK